MITGYSEYLETPEWKAKRLWALERAGYRCLVCNSPNKLQVHHRSYDRLGSEEPNDLAVLCDVCHELFSKHGRWAFQRKAEEQIRQRAREVERKQQEEIRKHGTSARLWYEPETVGQERLLKFWKARLAEEPEPENQVEMIALIAQIEASLNEDTAAAE